MTATAEYVARYTNDGIAITFNAPAIKATHPAAIDAGEIETFFRYEADVQAMSIERQLLTAVAGGMHEAVEVDTSLGIGTTIAIAPVVPNFGVVDDSRGLSEIGRTRSFAFDGTLDRYSVELVG